MLTHMLQLAEAYACVCSDMHRFSYIDYHNFSPAFPLVSYYITLGLADDIRNNVAVFQQDGEHNLLLATL